MEGHCFDFPFLTKVFLCLTSCFHKKKLKDRKTCTFSNFCVFLSIVLYVLFLALHLSQGGYSENGVV